MFKALKFLLAREKRSVGTVIVVGAGTGSMLSDIMAMQPDSVILVEANEQLAVSLSKKTRKLPNVSVLNKWLVPGFEPIQTYEFSNPRYNSIAPPSEKLKSFANIKMIRSEKKIGKSFVELIKDLKISTDKVNCLLFSVSGSEEMFLTNSNEQIHCFDFILIDCKQSDFYLSPWGVDKCIKGFNLTNFIFNNEAVSELLYSRKAPNVNELELELSKLGIEKERLRLDLDEHMSTIDSLKQNLNELKDEVRLKEEELLYKDSRIKELIEQNEHNEDKLNKELIRLAEERRLEADVLQKTCKLNLKIQSDLDHVRIQYFERLASEKELTQLVKELYVKLKKASEFYMKLEEHYPEIARSFDD